MLRSLCLLISILFIFPTSSTYAQCPFEHSPYNWLKLDQEVYQATNVYPGEYVSFEMKAGVCYNMLVIDTAELALHLSLYDRNTEQLLGLAITHGGEALALTYRPNRDQTVNLALNLPNCKDLWQPMEMVVESAPHKKDCRPPTDRMWVMPLEAALSIGKGLFAH